MVIDLEPAHFRVQANVDGRASWSSLRCRIGHRAQRTAHAEHNGQKGQKKTIPARGRDESTMRCSTSSGPGAQSQQCRQQWRRTLSAPVWCVHALHKQAVLESSRFVCGLGVVYIAKFSNHLNVKQKSNQIKPPPGAMSRWGPSLGRWPTDGTDSG